MTSHLDLKQQEEDSIESSKEYLAEEAARQVVLNQESRAAAIKTVCDVVASQYNDRENGHVADLGEGEVMYDDASSNFPQTPQPDEKQTQQINAVAKELLEEFDIELSNAATLV